MRLLIVEDEEKLAAGLARGFEKYGYASDILHNGNDAINRISLYRNEYAVIILDLMLPGAPGEEICRIVREMGVTTPIIILTARDTTESKVDVLNRGADDYMAKPFSFEELLARVQALSRRPVAMQQPILNVDGLTLDPMTHLVQYRDENIPLTLKEFAILEYLMRNPGAVVARDTILDNVWDFEFNSFSNVVDVHVKNLRKKLSGASGITIETVRGVGYRLVA